jgi:hypothetical protein
VTEPSLKAQTLVDRELVVGTTPVTVTFDARQGRLVAFSVNDPTATALGVSAEPYSPATGRDAFDGYASPFPGKTYVVPGKMASGYVLFLEASLSRPNLHPSPIDYVLIKQLGAAIPARLSFSATKAGLATYHVAERAVESYQMDEISVAPLSRSGAVPIPAGQFGSPPFGVTFRLTPGYGWDTSTLTGSDTQENQPRLAGHTYTQTLNRAVFGPTANFGPSVGRRARTALRCSGRGSSPRGSAW